ncbi:importin subunit alpha [Anaeramoeba flamelloides]|uniref:Importin subunit alpha n=1 Tax=Anaeramoeba flamelloides TaxID=1746091 RepID=A0AAV7ZHL8_9EUKA|nr:importin subunit alpha [Anaeramoeba flamelloides]
MFTNLCTNESNIDSIKKRSLIEIFLSCLEKGGEFQDKEIIRDSCNGIHALTNKGQDLDILLSYECIPNLILLLNQEDESLQNCSLSIIWNIAFGDDQQLDLLLQESVLESLFNIFKISNNEEVLVDILFIFANLVCGNLNQIQQVLDSGILSEIFKIHRKEKFSNRLQIELMWIITNLCTVGEDYQMGYLLDIGAFDFIVNVVLNYSLDKNIYYPCLISINLLIQKIGKQFISQANKKQVFNKIETLQDSESNSIAIYSQKIIEQFDNYNKKINLDQIFEKDELDI